MVERLEGKVLVLISIYLAREIVENGPEYDLGTVALNCFFEVTVVPCKSTILLAR